MHIKTSKNKKIPGMLVVAPTRELAIQTHDVLAEAGKSAGIRAICLYGGSDKGIQREALKRGVNIVVCTPGRLLDFVNEGSCDLSNIEYLVLDEADRMLDMGFENDIRAIIRQVPKNRQTVMFSATWPSAIQGLAMEFLRKPIKITIGSEDLVANKNVKQIVEVIENRSRDERLIQLLKEYHSSRSNKLIIFVLYKKEAVRVHEFLKRRGYNAASIHGDLSQNQRLESLKSFMENTTPLLIATDVAARGLDIPKVEYVINFTFPLTIEDYVHRIGRTGRAGAKGISHTFFQDVDKHHAGGLVTLLKDVGQPLPATHAIMKFPLYTKKKENKPAEFKLGPIDIHAKSDGHVEFSDSE
jgi:ATP-dependent RNA helicase DBP3